MDMSDEERLQRRRKKWIWGCTGGCLGLMGAVTAAIIGIYLWCARALPMPPPETFLTPGTSAFLFVRVAPDDPMMLEVPVRLAMLPGVRGQVPTKDGRPLKANANTIRSAVLGVAPVQLVFVGEPADGARFHWGVALSISRFGRLFGPIARALIAQGAREQGLAQPETYKGAAISVAEGGAAFAVHRNSYMAALDKPLLRAWLDGLQAERERAEPPEGAVPLPAGLDPRLLDAYDRLDRRSPVRFACLNAHGEVGGLLDLLPLEPARARLRAAGMAGPGVLSVGGQLRSLNSRDASLALRIACADEGAVERIQTALAALADGEELTPHFREPAVRRQDGTAVELTARIENLPDRVAALADHLADQGRRAAEP